MSSYPDVTENSPYFEAINFVSIFGIMVGDEHAHFNPSLSVSLDELCVIVCNLLQLNVSGYNAYSDNLSIQKWAQPYYNACLKNGLIEDTARWETSDSRTSTKNDLYLLLSNAQKNIFRPLQFDPFSTSDSYHSLDQVLNRNLCAFYIHQFCLNASTAIGSELFDTASKYFQKAFALFKEYDWISNFFESDKYQIASILHQHEFSERTLSQLQKMIEIWDAKKPFLFSQSDSFRPIYHYTSLKTLDILSRPDVKFRLSNAAYLNDPQEGIWGIQHLAKKLSIKRNPVLSSFLKTFLPSTGKMSPAKIFVSSSFIASFIKNCDDLPMWVQYAENGTGCCLEFDPTQISEPLYTVTYSKRAIQTFFSKILNILEAYTTDYPDVNSSCDPVFKYGRDILMQGCYLYKDSSYKHEKEVRIITFADLRKAKVKEDICPDETFPRIYWETALLKNRSDNIGLNFSSIILGPTVQNPEYVALALAQRGYNPGIIKKSQISFR